MSVSVQQAVPEFVTHKAAGPVAPPQFISTSLAAPGWYFTVQFSSSLCCLQCFKPDHTKANTCIHHSASMKAIALMRETAKISTCLKIVSFRERLFRVKRNSLESGYWSSLITSLSNDTEIPLIPLGLVKFIWNWIKHYQFYKISEVNGISILNLFSAHIIYSCRINYINLKKKKINKINTLTISLEVLPFHNLQWEETANLQRVPNILFLPLTCNLSTGFPWE